MQTVSFSEHYERNVCPECGIVCYVPAKWQRERREDHKTFYCPNGHSQWYPKENETEKLRRERDRLKQDAARLEEERIAAERRAEAAEEAARRANARAKSITKRSAAGTCPCCQRTFANMAEHMKHEHPDFVKGTGAKVVPIKRLHKRLA